MSPAVTRVIGVPLKVTKPYQSDYEQELVRIEADLASLAEQAPVTTSSGEVAAKYLYRAFQKISLTGNLAGLRSLESQIQGAIARVGPAEDLCLLHANLNFKLHRLKETRQALAMAPALPGRREGRSLLAEVDFQEGRYTQAEESLHRLIINDPTWSNFARLAHVRGKMGDLAECDRLYVAAEEELTAKEMRSFAWVKLQRGQAHASHGLTEQARRHYRRADRAYSGFWLVREHVADLLAFRNRLLEAASIYEELILTVPKPEILQKLGQVYKRMGLPDRAEPLFDRALTEFLRSADLGEVHYYHHLVEFFADARPNAQESLLWAKRDQTLRDNFGTQAALAWAHFQANEIEDAVFWISRALESGVHEPSIFAKARVIHASSKTVPDFSGQNDQ